MVAAGLIVGFISYIYWSSELFFATCNHLARWQTPNDYSSYIFEK